MQSKTMNVSTTLAVSALADLRSALEKVRRMMIDTKVIEWEILKAIFSLEEGSNDRTSN